MKNFVIKNKKLVTWIKLISYLVPFILTLYLFLKIKLLDIQLESLRNQKIENRTIKLINHKFIQSANLADEIIVKTNLKLIKEYHCIPGIKNKYISCIKNKNEDIWSIGYTNIHTLCATSFTIKLDEKKLLKYSFTDNSFRSHCPTFFKTYFHQLYKINTWEGTMKAENTDPQSGAFLWSIYLNIFQSHPRKVFYEEINDGIIALTHDLKGGSQIIYIYYNGQIFNVKFKNQLSPDDPLPIIINRFVDNEPTEYKMLYELTKS
ncbi:hypothetical protein [Leptospira mtsangambouensis]|uniref:hypothetical protein n=1 Tax=Leptospira mtsangambouensis TaxID=2484912 RepID=UPI001EECB6F5|nr:hypothetical protein [Leptospira mtsangambouensis]MCG6142752.1 hypothetical protein [Leptospira mtsangambouensis]